MGTRVVRDPRPFIFVPVSVEPERVINVVTLITQLIRGHLITVCLQLQRVTALGIGIHPRKPLVQTVVRHCSQPCAQVLQYITVYVRDLTGHTHITLLEQFNIGRQRHRVRGLINPELLRPRHTPVPGAVVRHTQVQPVGLTFVLQQRQIHPALTVVVTTQSNQVAPLAQVVTQPHTSTGTLNITQVVGHLQ